MNVSGRSVLLTVKGSGPDDPRPRKLDEFVAGTVESRKIR